MSEPCPTCGNEYDSIEGLNKHHSSAHPNAFEELFWHLAGEKAEGECWEWRARTVAGGYGTIQRHNEREYAHRLAYKFHYGESPDPQINHHCDNPICVNPDHLYRGTHEDNMRDAWNRDGHDNMREGLKVGWENASENMKQAWEDGKMIDSEDSSFAKLSKEEAKEIKYEADRSRTQTSVADEYSVSREAVRRIWDGETWKEI